MLAIKECRKSPVRCGNCEKNAPRLLTVSNVAYFIVKSVSLETTSVMRSNEDHRVLAIKDFQDKDYKDVLQRPALCHKQGHSKEELKFFCKNCEMAVCQICVPLEHGGHTLNLIEEEAERQKIL